MFLVYLFEQLLIKPEKFRKFDLLYIFYIKRRKSAMCYIIGLFLVNLFFLFFFLISFFNILSHWAIQYTRTVLWNASGVSCNWNEVGGQKCYVSKSTRVK